MIYLFSFLSKLQFFGAVVVPFYLIRLEYSYTQMFLLETIFSISLFLFEIPTGVIADKYGRKISLFLGSLLFGLGFIGIGFVSKLWVFVILQVIVSIGLSLISGADKALIYENAKLKKLSDEQVTTITARYDAFGTAGLLIAFPLGSYFVSSKIMPYTQALGFVNIVSGFMSVVASVIILFVKDTKEHSNISSKKSLKFAFDGVKYIFQNKSLLKFSLDYAIISGLTFLMFWFYQSLLLDKNISVFWNGIIAASYNGLAMILLLFTGFLQKKIGTMKLLFYSSLLPGLMYISLFIFPNSLVIMFIAIYGITSLKMFRAPLLITQINTKISNENRATVLSGVSMLERIVLTVFYPIAGIFMDYANNYAYLIIGIITVVVSFLSYFLMKNSFITN